jgi:hypothetical protein
MEFTAIQTIPIDAATAVQPALDTDASLDLMERGVARFTCVGPEAHTAYTAAPQAQDRVAALAPQGCIAITVQGDLVYILARISF